MEEIVFFALEGFRRVKAGDGNALGMGSGSSGCAAWRAPRSRSRGNERQQVSDKSWVLIGVCSSERHSGNGVRVRLNDMRSGARDGFLNSWKSSCFAFERDPME